MALKWKDKYSLNHDVIDSQHKEWFKKVDDLMAACRQRKGNEKIGELLDFVVDYTVKHFSTEEDIQKSCGYPDIEKHKGIHNAFVKKVRDVKDEFDDRDGLPINKMVEVNSMLSKWLINHVTGIDQDIKEYLD